MSVVISILFVKAPRGWPSGGPDLRSGGAPSALVSIALARRAGDGSPPSVEPEPGENRGVVRVRVLDTEKRVLPDAREFP